MQYDKVYNAVLASSKSTLLYDVAATARGQMLLVSITNYVNYSFIRHLGSAWRWNHWAAPIQSILCCPFARRAGARRADRL